MCCAQGDLAGALAAYRAAAATAERLTELDSSNADWQLQLASNRDNIGEVLRDQGDPADALVAHQAALAAFERLADRNKNNTQLQNYLVVSHNRIGGLLQAQGDQDGALASFRAGLAIEERIAALEPDKAEWQFGLVASHQSIAAVMATKGDLDGAVATFRASLPTAERLVARDPGNPVWQRSLTNVLFGLAALSHLVDRHADAVRYGKPWVAALRERVGRTGEGASDLAKALGSLSAYYLFNVSSPKPGMRRRRDICARQAANLDHDQSRACGDVPGPPRPRPEIHARYRDAVVNKDGKRWPEEVADDFAAFRKAGLESPHMEAVQRLLASGY